MKSQLRRLPQNGDVWEADFGPLEGSKTWLGLVVCPPLGAILASEFYESVPSVNDLATLLAHPMRRPALGVTQITPTHSCSALDRIPNEQHGDCFRIIRHSWSRL